MNHQLMFGGQSHLPDSRGNETALTSQGELTKFHTLGIPKWLSHDSRAKHSPETYWLVPFGSSTKPAFEAGVI